MKKLFITVSILLLVFYSFSQESPTKHELYAMSLEELLNVSVASNIVKSDDLQPVSVATINRKQLELSGARTLVEAIMMYVPGFFMVEDQDDLIAGFRGLAPDNNSKVLFLINGQNVNTEWFWGPPSALLNSTNVGYIEKIEVIRGPGSVTLGQGALLGVLNIVTKNGKSLMNDDSNIGGKVYVGLGEDEYQSVNVEFMQRDEEFQSYFYFAKTDYEGQALRNEGWAMGHANEGYAGGQVYDIGTRLNRSYSTMLLGNMHYKNFSFNLIYADNEHDLYNFYRDRNVMGQKLISLGSEYRFQLNEEINFKVTVDAAIDNIELNSVEGYVMGGTRENRGGIKIIGNFDNLIKNNRLAIGVESRYYQFGQRNFSGHNFILNRYDYAFVDTMGDRIRIDSANLNNTMGYPDTYGIFSAILEDYYNFSEKLVAFGAVRYDMHPYWGSHISPRIGLIGKLSNKLNIRASYQAGFRGAVGLHYGGGYRQDGFLRADNYSEVATALIPIDPSDLSAGLYENLDKVKPEKMHSVELELDYKISENVSFDIVGFYNQIVNVIDVGVIWAEPSQYTMPAIGSDVPGTWNGYWYFKNTNGIIQQAGFEFAGSIRIDKFHFKASHSLVKLIDADEQQRGSMYITARDHFKAYPENVSRVHAMFDFTNNLSLAANYLYYYSWYSPRDQFVNGNHLLNFSGIFTLREHFEASFTVKNVLAQKELYPMNSNAGDASLSDGAPTLESTSYWIKLAYKF
jgi:outer membrane receptor for ferrienterochelin and colicin